MITKSTRTCFLLKQQRCTPKIVHTVLKIFRTGQRNYRWKSAPLLVRTSGSIFYTFCKVQKRGKKEVTISQYFCPRCSLLGVAKRHARPVLLSSDTQFFLSGCFGY